MREVLNDTLEIDMEAAQTDPDLLPWFASIAFIGVGSVGSWAAVIHLASVLIS
jgi:hypothetical protein